MKLILALTIAAGGVAWADVAHTQISAMQLAQARQMLRTVREAVRERYYDPTFGGRDVVAHFKTAEQKLDAAESVGRAYAVIAQALVDFGDSHTYFLPPEIPATFEYGWQMAIVGDRCLVLGVKPGSDAEAKGLRAGDHILQVETLPPTRAELVSTTTSSPLVVQASRSSGRSWQ